MTAKEHIADLKAKVSTLHTAFEFAVRDTVARQAKRIFTEGRNSAGGNIGQYSTKTPFYINPNASRRKKGNKAKGIQGLKRAGKNGETKFKNGKPHLTAYMKNYKDFRNRIGSRIDKVNLVLTGDLQSDFSNATTGKDVATPRKKNNNSFYVAVTRDISLDKINGAEKKYGSIFKLTKQEREGFKEILTKELRTRL